MLDCQRTGKLTWGSDFFYLFSERFSAPREPFRPVTSHLPENQAQKDRPGKHTGMCDSWWLSYVCHTTLRSCVPPSWLSRLNICISAATDTVPYSHQVSKLGKYNMRWTAAHGILKHVIIYLTKNKPKCKRSKWKKYTIWFGSLQNQKQKLLELKIIFFFLWL